MEFSNVRKEAKLLVEDWLKSIFVGMKILEDENLIEKGLSSIQVMQLSGKLKKLGIRISFAELMDDPSLFKWLELIDNSKVKNDKNMKSSIIKSNDNKFELTDIQYSYLIGREDDQVLGGVGCHAYLEIDGENIKEDRLKKAWNKLQYRHPMLRAKFTKDGYQEIMGKPYDEEIEIFDLSTLDEETSSLRLIEIRTQLSHRKLNVNEGQVAGLSLAKLLNNKFRIFFDIDLLVSDVMSMSIIIKELAELYSDVSLDCLDSYTFKEYMQDLDNNSNYEDDKLFWKQKINSFEIERPNLPLKKQPEQIKETKFTRRIRIIEKEQWNTIKSIAASYNSTPSMVLLTAYALILERWCNQKKFFINIPLFNRDLSNENLKNMVGDFTNILLVEYESVDDSSFLDTLKRINKTFLENVSHSAYSGVQVQRDISRKQGTSVNVAPVVFACNIDYPLETELSRKEFGKLSYMISQTPGVWIDFQTYVVDGDLILCWDTVDELFPIELLDDMINSLYTLLISLTLTINWGKRVDVLPKSQKIIRKQEVEEILPLKYPDETLYDGFIRNVKLNPDKVAIIDSETKEQITYRKLYDISLRLADYLYNDGVKKGEYVGITLPRGSKQLYAIFGILFIGAAYVSIGISQPSDRRNKIYEQIGINHIISDEETIVKCSLNNEEVKLIDLDKGMNSYKRLESPVQVSPYDSAYIIMTSGTTGIPKGVEIMHTSAINTCIDLNEKYNVNSADTILMVSAIDFDLSVYDIFGVLRAGGTIVTTSEDNYRNPDEWLKLIDKYKVTIWNSVPILFDMIVTMAEGKNRQLPFRTVMLSGDWIAINLPERFYNISDKMNSVVVAMGGATEASIWSNYMNVPRKISDGWVSIPYGKPLKNQVYRVADSFGRVCPNYVKGELLIGGVGVAKGYYGDEELTEKKFFVEEDLRWYRTGDSGTTWNDGTIEFLGRIDKQVKIKGYRIELGEIEEAVRRKLNFKNVKVITNYRRNSLYAFVLGNNVELNCKELFIDVLPPYMIPDKLIFIKEFPVNKNGKVNVKKLIEIAENATEDIYKNRSYNNSREELSREIVDIFKEVTKNPYYEVNSNFFENGGDSLVALNILLKLNNKYNIELNMKDIFTSDSIFQLCDIIQSEIKPHKECESESFGLNEEKVFLTELQHSYWLNRVGYGNLERQNSNFYIELECKNLDVIKIKSSLNKIINKYNIFKNTISDNGRYFESIPKSDIEIKYNELSNESAKSKKELLENIRNRIMYFIDEKNLFDPIKIEVTKMDNSKTIMHICFDNIYFDAPSIMHILNELNLLYKNSDAEGFTLIRGSMPKINDDKLELDKRYWKNKINDIFPAPNLIKDSIKQERSSGYFKRISTILTEDQVEKLSYISSKYKITTSNIILSLFSEVIHYWSNSTDYTINVIVINNQKNVYDYFGEIADYTSNLLHTINYNSNESLYQRMNRIQDNLLKDIQHMSFEGTRVLRELRRQNKSMYENMPIVYTNTVGYDIDINMSNIGKIKEVLTQTPGVYLDLQVSVVEGKYVINWDYLTDMFEENEIKEKFGIFKKVLFDVLEDESFFECCNIIQNENFYEEGII